MARVPKLALLAVPAALLAAGPAAAHPVGHAAAAPAVSHLRASPSSLSHAGGTVRITAHIKHGRRCTLSARPSVRHLPRTISCRGTRVTLRVSLPANSSGSTRSYRLTLRLSGHGSASAHVTVRVAPLVGSTVVPPPPPPPAGDVAQIAAGYWSTCAVLANGHVYCWGAEYFGELGNGSDGESAVDEPVEVTGISEAVEVAVGEYDACALLADGHVECWGENYYGEIGNDKELHSSTEGVTTPTEVSGITNAKQITVGYQFACALLEGGDVKCWGRNEFGAIGAEVEPTVTPTFPEPESAKIDGALQISSLGYNTCAVAESGEVRCWGNADYGQLGNKVAEVEKYSDTPVKAQEIADATEVAATDADTCALVGGKAFCWGLNEYGQLGDGKTLPGDYETELTPQSASVSGIAQIVAGERYACALLTSGDADCWGSDTEGQLGDDEGKPNQFDDLPKQVPGLSEVTQLAAGTFHACAIDNGHAYCWGNDEKGEIGNGRSGTDVDALTPTAVTGLP